MSYELDILLPVYNEAKSIGSFIKSVDKSINKKIKYRFIICEDGSTMGLKKCSLILKINIM